VQELLHRGLAAGAEGDESISVGSLLAGSVQDNSVLHLSVLGEIFKQVGVLHPSRNTSYVDSVLEDLFSPCSVTSFMIVSGA